MQGDTADIMGCFIMGDIVLGNFRAKFKFQIVEKARYEVILGEDFLQTFAKSMNFLTRTIHWREKPLKLKSNAVAGAPPCKGKLVKGLRLTPGSSRTIEIYPDQNILCKEVIIQGLEDQKVMVQETVHGGLEDTMKVVVWNPLDHVIHLRAGTPVAAMKETRLAAV